MRFHLTMMFVVIAVAMSMHAMANAADKVTPEQAMARNAAMQHAGEELNTQLVACRDKAKENPKASKRDRLACERAARKQFRHDAEQARAL